MKLSIIVPIYKVEAYLDKCVQSLLTQDLPSSDYEVIMVDDGSPDCCPEMCDAYAKQYANIRVIHRPNGGLSAARNSGIAAAQGKYIEFLDSDDFLQPNVLGTLMSQAEQQNLDVLRYDYQHVKPSYEVFWPYKSPKQIDQCTNIVDGLTYLNTRMGYGCYAWQWMIRRELVSTFKEGIHFEDTEWLPRMMLAAQRVNATTLVVYNYLLREGSITGVVNDAQRRKNLEDQFIVIESLNHQYAQYPTCDWLKRMRSTMVATILTSVALSFYHERHLYIDRLNKLDVFPLSTNINGKTYKRRAVFINFSPHFYCWIQHILH